MRLAAATSLLRTASRLVGVLLSIGLVALPAGRIQAKPKALRTVTLSLQGVDHGGRFATIDAEIKKVKGVRATSYDSRTVEVDIQLEDGLAAKKLLAAVERAGFRAIEGAGQGRWQPPRGYPDGSDVGIVSEKGADVPELDSLAVLGKVTLVDFYADWCGPCRMLDQVVISLLQERSDLAVRKINIVDWSTPIVRLRMTNVSGIPYLIVYGKNGKRVSEVRGYRPDALKLAIEQGALSAVDQASSSTPSSP